MKNIYSLLVGLKNNIPQESNISRKYVDQYNALINQLSEMTKTSLDDFKISESVLEYTSGISRPGVGFQPFGEKKCERGLLLAKLDAILILFSIEQEKSAIGFQVPQT